MEYALRFNFKATNSEDGYEALVAGLELVRALGVRRILVREDSKLMMDQAKGDCGIKNGSLMRYHNKATTLAKSFAHIVFQHIPRSENEKTDRLSKLATTYYEELPKEVYIEVREQRAYEEIPVKIVLEESLDWKIEIAKILLERSLPADPNEARKLQRRNLSLVYGTEAVLPTEVELPTWRQRGFEEEQNSRALKEQLKFIDELRDKALFTMHKYKHLMARSYNRRVKGHQFRVGPDTYELEEMDGKAVPRTCHTSKLSKFHC
ncbi:hypothetical protein LIER_28714 [Lithospermum erythrorhizon]|uniref:RNase H type-1 domain-containing protein n=1 Tax=Lithospermum erythrorhizon TaxID=34254 RepID=A0AAV3RK58_LITER